MFCLIYPENFQNSAIKKQLHFPAVVTLEEMNGLLKYLIRSDISLIIHDICKFKTF